MKKLVFLSAFALLACNRNSTVHPPVGGVLSKSDLEVSKQRSKGLNTLEREQIQDWISNQKTPYYAMPLNYWTDNKEMQQRSRTPNDAPISYEYELYDFDQTKIYDEPQGKMNVSLGHFDELKSVEDALHYLKPGEEATLLVPSSLAYGTFGDEKKIDNDIPLIIKVKVL